MWIERSKLKVDWTSVKTAARTAGALMIGNVFVATILLGNRNWLALAMLLIAGAVLIMLTSVEWKE